MKFFVESIETLTSYAMMIPLGCAGDFQDTVSTVLGSTVVSPYVGMARKQNGGFNASISVQTPLVHLVANCTHQKTVRSAL